jgi:hypothetical protein
MIGYQEINGRIFQFIFNSLEVLVTTPCKLKSAEPIENTLRRFCCQKLVIGDQYIMYFFWVMDELIKINGDVHVVARENPEYKISNKYVY